MSRFAGIAPGRQQGLAVLLLLLMLLTGALMHISGAHALLDTVPVEKSRDRAQRLYQAKQALIAYSVSYADNYQPGSAGPGHLPCPDRSPINDGIESNDGPDPPCSRASSLIGRFPRYTWSRDSAKPETSPNSYPSKRLVFYAHRSLKDEQMWYSVSRSHVNNPSNLKVNPATAGWLTVDGRRDIVAVIIDPGPGLPVNEGVRPGDNARAYLEGINANADTEFTQPVDDGISNDLLVSLSRDELMQGVMQRVGLFITRQLLLYRNQHCTRPGSDCFPPAANSEGSCSVKLEQGRLPLYPGNCGSALLQEGRLQGIDAGKHWFMRNGWPDFVHYTRDAACARDNEEACEVRVTINNADPPGYTETGGAINEVPMINIRISVGAEPR